METIEIFSALCKVVEEAVEAEGVVHPVAVLVAPGRIGFSSRSIQTSMCTVWERIGPQHSLFRQHRVMTM